jgi:5-methylcytosine-specific restriction endonuclease McrA
VQRIKNNRLNEPLKFVVMEANFKRAKAKGEKHLKKYIRNASSNYIKRKAVRDFIFSRDQYKCIKCGSTEDLQIDHIVSVYKIGLSANHIENLQTLCKVCNAGKEV